MVFQLTDSNTKLFFDQDDNGQSRLFYGSAGGSFYKLEGLDATGFHLLLAVISSLFFVWVLIAWPVQKFTSRRLPSKLEHLSRLSLWGFALVVFLTLIGIAMTASEEIVFGMTNATKSVLTFAYLIPSLALVSLFSVIRLMTDDKTELQIRFFHLVLVVLSVAVGWQFNYWNLVGA
jgi:hypothetical protein